MMESKYLKSKYLVLLLATLTIVAVIFISGCVQQVPLEQPGKNLSFVYAQGTEFMIDGKPFRFVGAFAFPIFTEYLYGKSVSSLKYKWNIDRYFESLPENVNVIRVFTWGPYMKNFYGYTEPNWERLDYFVKSAEAHGIYIIWVLHDYWDYTPTGVQPVYHYKFWEDESAKQIILKQVERYKDSPAIFAWELMNEGDAQTIWNDAEWSQVVAWIEDVSKAIKAIDNRHLVSTGFSNENMRETYFYYPYSYPARHEAVINVHKLLTIDFVTFHVYGSPAPDFQTNASFFTEQFRTEVAWYFTEMDKIRKELNKPAVVEEFGTQRQVGEPVRKQVYEFYFGQLLSNNMSGCFNSWADDKWPYSASIYTYDEEYNTVLDAAERMKNIP